MIKFKLGKQLSSSHFEYFFYISTNLKKKTTLKINRIGSQQKSTYLNKKYLYATAFINILSLPLYIIFPNKAFCNMLLQGVLYKWRVISLISKSIRKKK